MIKVLIVVSYLSGGGAEHVARKNLECLLDNTDFQVGVLTCDAESAKKYTIESYLLQDFKKLDGKLTQGIAVFGYHSNYYIALKCMRQFRPDIIHIHDFIPMTPSTLKAIHEYKAESGCKVVLTHHTYSYICTNDSLYNYSSNQLCEECIGKLDTTIIRKKCSGKLTTAYAKYLQKKCFTSYWNGLIDLHISPSVFLKQKLLQADKNLSVQVVHNPCIDEVLPVSNQKKTDTIVYFGRISREKNIVNFARLFAEIPTNYQLLIVGDGKLSSELEQIISKSQSQKIRFVHRFMQTNELFNTISSAKYFILPSVWYENSPVSIVEAINWSLIPLVSNIGGMEELVQLFGLGQTFDPKDSGAIQSLIQNLDNFDCFNKLQSSRIQLQKFTTIAYSKQICDIYHRLMI